MNVYKKYMKLDSDFDGLLGKQEFQQYSWGITPLLVDRVFEVYNTYGGKIDYKTYLDFVLAIENKKYPQSISYLWKILDVYNKGAIDSFVINMFCRQIVLFT